MSVFILCFEYSARGVMEDYGRCYKCKRNDVDVKYSFLCEGYVCARCFEKRVKQIFE